MTEFEDLIKEKEWIKFENNPVYFKQFIPEEWEIYIFSNREKELIDQFLKEGIITKEYAWNWFTIYSDHIYWEEPYLSYDILCYFAASCWFGVDGNKFNYYKEQYEKLTGRKWNAGFIKN